MANFVIQKSPDIAEFLAHKKWVADQAVAARMNEESARRCVEKLKAKGESQAFMVEA